MLKALWLNRLPELNFSKGFKPAENLNVNFEIDTDKDCIGLAGLPFIILKGYGDEKKGYKIQSGFVIAHYSFELELRVNMGRK